MSLLMYVLTFIGSMLVDMVPVIGPPAWMVMVFFYVKYDLNIWIVLILGVSGSALGRFIYSSYVMKLSDRFIKKDKSEDLQFIGKRLSHSTWKVQLFVFLVTLLPLPSTPLFTAVGMSRFRVLAIIPAFFAGKFISDALMVHAGDFVVENFQQMLHGLLSWKSIAGTVLVLIIVCFFLFIDWRMLIEKKKFRLNFKIWK